MYHPTVISAKIARALADTFPNGTPSWHNINSAGVPVPPTRHSRFEVQSANERLSATREIDDSGSSRVIRAFTPEEIAWIRNERFLCKVDFHYFSSRYCWIKNEKDEVVQFDPWVSQRIFLDVVSEMEIERTAVRIQQLKARHLGISRIVSLLILHRTAFFPHVNALIGSSTPSKTLKLLDMLEFVFDRLPFWLIPELTARRRDGEGGFIEFGRMDTGITLQHGAQMSGIARGTTPTVFHLTELAEFANAKSIVDASLMRAAHESERSFGVLEGTGEGKFNWWHKKWLSNKEGWPERRAQFRPEFLPWFVGRDIYPEEAWLRARPVPNNYRPAPHILSHSAKCAEYVRQSPLLRKYLGDDWRLPVEQQWFYEVEYDAARREDRLNEFIQEMPASDDEAFQSSNLSVFDREILNVHRSISGSHSPVGVYGLIGNEANVPLRVQPHRTLIDYNSRPIEIISRWGRQPIHYQLVPLRWGGYSTDSGLDKIYIWEHPIPNTVYGIGVDTSYGVEKDRTVLEILRKGDTRNCASQAAEFSSAKLNATDVTPFCMALASYYSTMPFDGNPIAAIGGDGGAVKQCRVAIECRGNGDQTQLQMRFLGWSNFHPWQRIDNRVIDPSSFNKIGVYTNEWFRAGLMEMMTKMVRDLEIKVYSPWLVDEMESLETEWDRNSLRAAVGGHDDRFMAMGFIVVSLYQWEKDRPVSFAHSHPLDPYVNSSYLPPTPSTSPRQYARYRPSTQLYLPSLSEVKQ